jgi:ribonuclease G
MSKELVVSSTRHETRVAILEDDQLVEIYFQRSNEYSLAGSIHKGRVTRVLPGMQSAFVDLGLERDTFLYVSDFFLEEADEDIDSTPSREAAPAKRRQPSAQVEPPSAPAPAAAPVIAAVDEGTDAPVAVEQRDGSGVDRRGRRSRRRRSRGKGFPDSKYASDLGVAEGEPVAQEETDAEPEEVLLLPGESLAKYSSRGQDGVDIFDADDTGSADAVQSVLLGKDEEPDDSEITALDRADEAQPDSPLNEEDSEDDFELSAVSASTTDEVEVPEETDETEETEDTDDEALSRLQPAEETSDDFDAVLSEIESLDEDEGSSSHPGAVAASLLRDETPRMISDEEGGEGDSEGNSESLTEAGEREEDAASVQDEEDALDSLPGEVRAQTPQSASVRDSNESRFQHRVSRRSRRRRGGDRGDRGERSDRADRDRTTAQVEAPPAVSPLEVRASKPADVRERSLPSISDLLREGQEIIVQIAKEPLGQKGARITSHIALPGRYVVFMPTLEHVGVSRKIASDEERLRLKRILQTHRTGMTGGFIVRTAGEGKTEDEIAGDMAYLYNLWLDIRQKAEKRRAPCLLHHDLDIVQRILRDQLSDTFKAIWCDNEDMYETVLHFMQRFNPPMVGRVKLYTRQAPIFDAFSITGEIEKALRPKVWLKSGGYIVVNQTEALVAIDVNTGKYIGKSNRLEDTITKTNTEAVKEIVRQVRLRDLGGIIVIDFIDMDERKNRQKVMQALEEAMRADRAPYKILQFNDFGLVAITRKRVKQSLERALCNPCPVCEGAGYTKSIQTVISEVLQEAIKIRGQVEGKNVVLRCYPEVAKYLKSSKNTHLEEIEEVLGRPMLVISDPMLHPDKFDIAW